MAVLGLICWAWVARCSAFSWCRAWALGVQTSVIVAHSLVASMWNLPTQGLNTCPLHWQADGMPLECQGSPGF